MGSGSETLWVTEEGKWGYNTNAKKKDNKVIQATWKKLFKEKWPVIASKLNLDARATQNNILLIAIKAGILNMYYRVVEEELSDAEVTEALNKIVPDLVEKDAISEGDLALFFNLDYDEPKDFDVQLEKALNCFDDWTVMDKRLVMAGLVDEKTSRLTERGHKIVCDYMRETWNLLNTTYKHLFDILDKVDFIQDEDDLTGLDDKHYDDIYYGMYDLAAPIILAEPILPTPPIIKYLLVNISDEVLQEMWLEVTNNDPKMVKFFNKVTYFEF